MTGPLLYLDCFSGIAGDMMLGALLDLGLPRADLEGALRRISLPPWRLAVERVQRMTLGGTAVRFVVEGEEHPHDPDDHHHEHPHDHHEHPHDHALEHHVHHHGLRPAEIEQRILAAGLPVPVEQRAIAIFGALAEAEARVHGTTVAEVHFHEVGAVDSILDIVGVAYGLWKLGIDRVESAPPPISRGFVRTAHGRMPLPTPATLELLRGLPLASCPLPRELVTPTGAAILRTCADAVGDFPAMVATGIGWGAGQAELADRPNLLRLVLGHRASMAPDCWVVEANIDDMSPEVAGFLLEMLFEAGALDAWFVPLHMKKSRPGLLVGALAPSGGHAAIEQVLLSQSTAIGLRRHAVSRHVLPRRMVEVDTPFGPIPIKVAYQGDVALNAAPEHEVCAARARAAGVPLKVVYQHAVAAWVERSRR
ncbi:MAG: nickel pincer cofactor biosynthesis protein LarC [bacterium]